MTEPLVAVERDDDGVALVRLQNGKVNSLSSELLRQLRSVAQDLTANPPGAVVVTGSERIFAAGADISEFGGTEKGREIGTLFLEALNAVAAIPRMVIAAVSGPALGGGCELALACDLRVAGRSARFGQPEIKLGLLPGGGGTQRLSRLVGPGRAMRMVLTGEMVEAEEAERIGLVDLVVDDAELPRRTTALARQIAAHSPVAVRMAKEALRAAVELPLGQGLERERELFLEAFASEDATEGIAAFLEKREPRFRGR